MDIIIALLNNFIFQIVVGTVVGGYASWWTARYFVKKRFRGNEEFEEGSGIIRIDADGKEYFGEGYIADIDWDRLRVRVVSNDGKAKITVPFIRFAQYRVVWVNDPAA